MLLGVLTLAACGGDDAGRGLADTRGVSRNFCSALEDFATTYEGVEGNDLDLASLRRDSQAIVELIPADAPDEVTMFFEALTEMADLSADWYNPETGGIKEEFVPDFLRLLGATTGDPAAATEAYTRDQCQARPGRDLSDLFAGEGGPLPSPDDGGLSPSAPPVPAEVVTVLDDGPAGDYEQVTVDIATVTATNAEPADAFTDEPMASGGDVLLVEIDAATDGSASNQFSADDFRLTDASGSTTTAQSVIDRSGATAPLQLRGRDSATGIVVFATDSLVTDLRGYTVSIDRDGRVPTVLSFGEPVARPYPIGLDARATGTFEIQAGSCVDNYETSVATADADLDADLGGSSGVVRSERGQRWVRIALDVTNVTVQGPSTNDAVCQAFSGNFAGVELRLDADGRLTAPANEKAFDQIEPGTTAERVHVFPVAADARVLVLVGPAGETLGQWTVEFPGSPGEA